jgi:hypothetical protein
MHYERSSAGYRMLSFPDTGRALEQSHLVMKIFSIIRDEDVEIQKGKK